MRKNTTDRTIVNTSGDTRLEWRSGHISVDGWLAELQEFRGRVAWAGGRRPAFRLPDGAFQDADPHDQLAHHLILRDRVTGCIAGCIRYAALEKLGEQSRVRALDPAAAAEILRSYNESEVLEGARLIVDPAWQRQGLATRLLIAGTALARVCGRRLIWGTAGNRQRQEEVFLRLGYRRATDTLIPAPKYDEDLSLIVCEPQAVPADIEADVRSLMRELTADRGRLAAA